LALSLSAFLFAQQTGNLVHLQESEITLTISNMFDRVNFSQKVAKPFNTLLYFDLYLNQNADLLYDMPFII